MCVRLRFKKFLEKYLFEDSFQFYITIEDKNCLLLLLFFKHLSFEEY